MPCSSGLPRSTSQDQQRVPCTHSWAGAEHSLGLSSGLSLHADFNITHTAKSWQLVSGITLLPTEQVMNPTLTQTQGRAHSNPNAKPNKSNPYPNSLMHCDIPQTSTQWLCLCSATFLSASSLNSSLETMFLKLQTTPVMPSSVVLL